jgi:hypothetical protein
MTDLRLDFCSHDAATFAVRSWHYSHAMPASRRVCIGAREDGRFVGAIVFSRGAARHIGRPFGLRQSEVCELTRAALRDHITPTSRIVAIAVRMLRRHSPGLKLIVSYADPRHDHVGVLYQAMNWLYLGPTNRESLLRVHGRLLHPRTAGSRYGHRGIDWLRAHVDARAERIVTEPKHKYVFPFDSDVRAHLQPLVRPYPMRPKTAGSCTIPAGLEGAMPIRPLSPDEAAHV